jgi:hypothetical protein
MIGTQQQATADSPWCRAGDSRQPVVSGRRQQTARGVGQAAADGPWCRAGGSRRPVVSGRRPGRTSVFVQRGGEGDDAGAAATGTDGGKCWRREVAPRACVVGSFLPESPSADGEQGSSSSSSQRATASSLRARERETPARAGSTHKPKDDSVFLPLASRCSFSHRITFTMLLMLVGWLACCCCCRHLW